MPPYSFTSYRFPSMPSTLAGLYKAYHLAEKRHWVRWRSHLNWKTIRMRTRTEMLISAPTPRGVDWRRTFRISRVRPSTLSTLSTCPHAAHADNTACAPPSLYGTRALAIVIHNAIANRYSDHDTKARYSIQQLCVVYNDKTALRRARGAYVVDVKLAQRPALYIRQTMPCPWPQAKCHLHKGIAKRGRGVEDDNKNLSYRSALKSFEVERSDHVPRECGKKDTA